nr:immunoglobulin light chain junction region [Macaca mulatta]MOW06112.1 immunoglobulin light chain junction region [Macaca mulatta]MOW06278.1 immunoglobulin light chain junction region [Macaca mulatta]MOW06402.1 immunoglobulin light chain junction region [Macaca mulatta]MOW06413.1 immunoglobulin light chain junction region [Macaca mulatta]
DYYCQSFDSGNYLLF